jgi:hypothetical protein
MGWVRLDDNFADHPKVITLSDTAFRLYIEGLCYSNRQLTDGLIPFGVYAKMSKEDDAQFLIEAGLWLEDAKGYRIRSYEEYQPTRKKVEQKRTEAKERLKKFRDKKGNEIETQKKRHPQPNPTQPNPSSIDTDISIEQVPTGMELDIVEEPEYLPETKIPKNASAQFAVYNIINKLDQARKSGVNAWNLSRLVEEQWDELHSENDIAGCIALTAWYVSELQSRKLNKAEYGRIGQMTKRFGRISLLAIDEAASKDLKDLLSYAFRVAQRMYTAQKV